MGYDDYGMGQGFLAAYFFVLFLFGVVFYVISSVFMMKIFEKAGVQGKWRAWVPVYNTMIFYKLGDLSPWLALGFLLTWIPFLGWLVGVGVLVLSLLAAWRVGLKLQKEAVWVVLYFFLSLVWMGILAFDKSRWNTNIVPAAWAGNGFLADRTVWEGVPVQTTNLQGPPQPGYGAPQGYAAPPQGYVPPQPGAPAAPPAQGAPVPPAPTTPPAPATPPAAPTTPPTTPPAPPAAPPAPPAAPPATPPAPPADPNQPPA